MGARQPIVVTAVPAGPRWLQHTVRVTQVKAVNAARHTSASPLKLGKGKSIWQKDWPFLTREGLSPVPVQPMQKERWFLTSFRFQHGELIGDERQLP